MQEVRWERMFPDQLEKAFAECPVLYLAYGLCEPHGPHCALGLDALKAHGIACAAPPAPGGLVAPPGMWPNHELSRYALWRHHNGGQPERTWLTSLPPWQHFRNVLYHIRTADVHGFHAALLVTGHYGPNWQDLKKMVDLVQPHVGTRLYALPDFEANQPGFDNDGHSGGDHAGKVETSLLWALEPGCVDLSRVPAEDEPGCHFAMGATVRHSDRRTGERMVADEVHWLGEKARELQDSYDREGPAHTLRTFAQVETLWEDVVRPHLKEFLSMQDLWSGQQPLPEESRWYANWRVPEA